MQRYLPDTRCKFNKLPWHIIQLVNRVYKSLAFTFIDRKIKAIKYLYTWPSSIDENWYSRFNMNDGWGRKCRLFPLSSVILISTICVYAVTMCVFVCLFVCMCVSIRVWMSWWYSERANNSENMYLFYNLFDVQSRTHIMFTCCEMIFSSYDLRKEIMNCMDWWSFVNHIRAWSEFSWTIYNIALSRNFHENNSDVHAKSIYHFHRWMEKEKETFSMFHDKQLKIQEPKKRVNFNALLYSLCLFFHCFPSVPYIRVSWDSIAFA